jgi:flagellar biosynthesis GTPase FlhF
MPRGNDADAASRELAARYRTRGNAEDLVQANMLRRDQTLAKAGLLARDDEATDELELKDVQSEVDDDNVIDFAVRGDYLVTVSEDEDGNVYKSAQPRKDTRAAKQAEKDEESDKPAKDADVLEHANRKAAIEKSAREAEKEIEEKVQKAREEAQEEHAKKTQEAADKSAEKSEKSDKPQQQQQPGRK